MPPRLDNVAFGIQQLYCSGVEGPLADLCQRVCKAGRYRAMSAAVSPTKAAITLRMKTHAVVVHGDVYVDHPRNVPTQHISTDTKATSKRPGGNSMVVVSAVSPFLDRYRVAIAKSSMMLTPAQQSNLLAICGAIVDTSAPDRQRATIARLSSARGINQLFPFLCQFLATHQQSPVDFQNLALQSSLVDLVGAFLRSDCLRPQIPFYFFKQLLPSLVSCMVYHPLGLPSARLAATQVSKPSSTLFGALPETRCDDHWRVRERAAETLASICHHVDFGTIRVELVTHCAQVLKSVWSTTLETVPPKSTAALPLPTFYGVLVGLRALGRTAVDVIVPLVPTFLKRLERQRSDDDGVRQTQQLIHELAHVAQSKPLTSASALVAAAAADPWLHIHQHLSTKTRLSDPYPSRAHGQLCLMADMFL